MTEYLQNLSWRALVWLIRLHTRWDKRSTLKITTTTVPTVSNRTKELALQLVTEGDELLGEHTIKRYGDFQTGDRVEIRYAPSVFGHGGKRGVIEDLNETVAAVRFTPTSAATFYLTDLLKESQNG